MAITPKDLRILYQRSGNRCAFPTCSKILIQPDSTVENPVVSSEVAHIVSRSPDGPRGRYALPQEERDRYGNLILLCEEHHHLVDGAWQEYSVERLRQIKDEHEALITDATGRAVADRVESKANQPHITETLHSTLLPVLRLPRHIYTVPLDYNDAEEKKASKDLVAPFEEGTMYPFVIRGGNLIAFRNLQRSPGPFRNLVGKRNVSEELAVDWWNGDDNQRSWFVTLLNRSLNKLTGRKGLNLDRDHNRYFFEPETAGKPLAIHYHPLNQKSSSRQVVWQPVTRKTGLPKKFWYHLAVSLRFHQVSSTGWCLSVRPEVRVTKDGIVSLDAEDIGSKVTKKLSRTFNHNVLSDLQFWRDFLSDGQPRITLKYDKYQMAVIGSSLMRAEVLWPGMPEDFAKAFKNVDFSEDLFSLSELAELEAAQEDEDSWDEEDSDEGEIDD